MSESRWWNYLQRLMGSDNAQTAAHRASISSSNFSRWKKGANADPEFVVKIARAYHANVLEALIEAEFITDDEAHLTNVFPDSREMLMRAHDEDLTNEVLRRLREKASPTEHVDHMDRPRPLGEPELITLHGELSKEELSEVMASPEQSPIEQEPTPSSSTRQR